MNRIRSRAGLAETCFHTNPAAHTRENTHVTDRTWRAMAGWVISLALGSMLLSSCGYFHTAESVATVSNGAEAPRSRELTQEQFLNQVRAGQVSFSRDIKPIIDQRCVVCHGCYDAPCQLKLESPLALNRGASKVMIYDGDRLTPIAPSRMGVDAATTAEWRQKGFHPVLDESSDAPETQLKGSVLARMLALKQQHPLPTHGTLSHEFDFGLNRTLECPRLDEFDGFARKHPGWGMPYGLPGLKPEESRQLLTWIEQGARYPAEPPPAVMTAAAVNRWESFMNGSRLKERLVARYVYEHLFMGHLHFKGHDPREFFRLVRSSTPPGEPIREIPTVRPYDDPGRQMFYRLQAFRQTIVDKNHDVYEIGDERIRRLRELFLDPDYEITEWPGYQAGQSANPFRIFAALPPQSRYRFMLDDAYFFISGFMKGPVCRGQVALNVIRDQFWIVFYDPGNDRVSNDADFLKSEANWLRLPSEKGDEVELDDLIVTYTEAQKRYLTAKNSLLARQPDNDRNAIAALWNGDGTNPNAALTAFRHFDSASLLWGFVGDRPQTVWAVDYPLFERIHYLLVAGFNVFGSITHQAATRLYMDNLRMEAENNFLSFFPASARPGIYHQWNRGGLLSDINSALVNPYYGYGKDSAVIFKSRDYATEVFEQMEHRLGRLTGPENTLYRCQKPPCNRTGAKPMELQADQLLKPLTFLKGGGIRYLPELSFLRIHDTGANPDQGNVYSLVQNKALENVSFMLWEKARRLPEEDTLTIVPGFAGSYPNFFFDVDVAHLPDFVSRILNLPDEQAAQQLENTYGVHRTHPNFWAYSDFFNRRHQQTNPITAGLFDLNRYENR